MSASQHGITIRGGVPALVFVRQHAQTGDRPVISVENPVVEATLYDEFWL